MTVVLLFWCHLSIATGSSAVTPYIDLLNSYPRFDRQAAAVDRQGV